MPRLTALTIVLLLPILFAAAAAPPPDSNKPNLPAKPPAEADVRKQLAGVWRGYAVEGKGENPDRGPAKLELTISETAIHGIQIKNEERVDHGKGDFTLNLAADPRHLDAAKSPERGRRQAYIGIYKLEGDTLQWCVSPQKERPTTFETRKGQFLLILKRAEPAK